MKDLKLAGINVKNNLRRDWKLLGEKELLLIGGPCAVESWEQMRESAKIVKKAGGRVLRGGVFKPRTSPYSFQGLGHEGLEYLVNAAKEEGLLTVTEVIDIKSLEEVADKVDIIQIGARNMQNYQLLKAAGSVKKPVILKRGLAATIEEWLLASEYILIEGNTDVILCERGIRTFETSTRNTLDLSAIGVVKELSHLPVIVDPSHAAGKRSLVPALAKAAVAGGADGLLIEMHPNPESALSDGAQSLTPSQLIRLAEELNQIANSIGKRYPLSKTIKEGLLKHHRKEIDLLDLQIVKLIAQRLNVVKEIAEVKETNQIKDIEREENIKKRLSDLSNELNISSDLIIDIYSLILNHSVKSQISYKVNSGISFNCSR